MPVPPGDAAPAAASGGWCRDIFVSHYSNWLTLANIMISFVLMFLKFLLYYVVVFERHF